ncbi:MAG: YvcK family protein [Desulfobulbaceae bacterium]|nr:MAG: YvcK family protein [Desulfobulbaceae bacterium]
MITPPLENMDNRELIDHLSSPRLSSFDLIAQAGILEQLVELVLNEIPPHLDQKSSAYFRELKKRIEKTDTEEINVVVFGGGTGLSNIIGGDCRLDSWLKNPFNGLKHVFPRTKAIVCITDDGGSTGEIIKDFPFIALGDIRHVLLSAVQERLLIEKYNISNFQALEVVKSLSDLFNHRFATPPDSAETLVLQSGAQLQILPHEMEGKLWEILRYCFVDKKILRTMQRPQCLGNLIIMAEIVKNISATRPIQEIVHFSDDLVEPIYQTISDLGKLFGAGENAVLPCTVTPAQLRFLYTNGVEVSGEHKSSTAERGYPVERVTVDFSGSPLVSKEVVNEIAKADLLIMAPGSLYSSIIPVLQVPGLIDAVRNNTRAVKLLIANLWVQAGETDKSISDPERKFHISDMIRAYQRNLPGGIDGLFDKILCMSLKDVPASVIQNYAIEGKIPIYLDKDNLEQQGFETIECSFYSKSALLERQVIHHDPEIVAKTVKTLFAARDIISPPLHNRTDSESQSDPSESRIVSIPSVLHRKITKMIRKIPIEFAGKTHSLKAIEGLRDDFIDIIWSHKDIPVSHLQSISAITCVGTERWSRDQRYDNVFSFYDPENQHIVIRNDRFENRKKLEVALLIAIGQSLLGNYAADKTMIKIQHEDLVPGSVYKLVVRDQAERHCYFTDEELSNYLQLARMKQQSPTVYTRLVNGNEGFTPPGVLFGVMYAWYLDNRLASHIEYKMSVLKVQESGLIPEQSRVKKRRERLIAFFRNSVFGKVDKLV